MPGDLQVVAWFSKTGHGDYVRCHLLNHLKELTHGGQPIWQPLVRLSEAQAEIDSWAQQASDRVDDAVQFAQERDALKAKLEALDSSFCIEKKWRKDSDEEAEALRLPKSYGGSTFETWGGKGCTVRFHFSDMRQAEAWVNALTGHPKGGEIL